MIFKKKRAPRVRVAAIIIENGKILLIAHKKNNNVYWLLPGGGVKFCESLQQALVRELHEELNISVNVCGVRLICDSVDPSGKRHILNICFYCSDIKGKYILGADKRLHNFGFFGIDELAYLRIFPPIKDEIKNILNNTEINNIYLGARWMKI